MVAPEGEGVGPGGCLLPLSHHEPLMVSPSTEPGPAPLRNPEPCPMLRAVSTVLGALLGLLFLGLLGLLILLRITQAKQRGVCPRRVPMASMAEASGN